MSWEQNGITFWANMISIDVKYIRIIQYLGCVVGMLFLLSTLRADQVEQSGTFSKPENIEDIFYNSCYDCHDEVEQKGNIRLDQLGNLDLDTRLNVLNKVQEQLYFNHMPPKDKKKFKLSDGNRKLLLEWVGGELGKHGASRLEGKLRTAKYANYVDHDKLFSGEYKDVPGYTLDRKWLISGNNGPRGRSTSF